MVGRGSDEVGEENSIPGERERGVGSDEVEGKQKGKYCLKKHFAF